MRFIDLLSKIYIKFLQIYLYIKMKNCNLVMLIALLLLILTTLATVSGTITNVETVETYFEDN